jgi:predicted ATPase/class 3 adenylate cyclase
MASGTLTFLATDIQGSTGLWESEADAMAAALARHDALLRRAIEGCGGRVFKTTGDGTLAAFVSAPAALTAALEAQRALWSEPWPTRRPLRVRIALHAGEAEERDGDFFGPPVNRLARILSAGHGGQVLLSRAAEALVADRLPVGATLRDLGPRSLKDLTAPERLFQLVAPDLPDAFPPLLTLDARPHNLPAQLTPLVGREEAVRRVRRLLLRDGVRLVTLTGPGGTGKTRLAIQVAAEVVDAFRHGAYLINLVTVRDPRLLATSILAALGATREGDEAVETALENHLRSREILLVLDNFEQILESAPTVSRLLEKAPRLKVLVTSQAVLRLSAEHEVAVSPLELPPPGASSPAALRASEAVSLFLQRARAVAPSFELTERNAPAVAGIVRQLDGLPLALELAAARVKLFPPEALLRRLDRAFDVLTSGERDRPDRHRTLRNAIDWTYRLLSEGDRKVFERTAVFHGGFTLDAAEAVVVEPGEEIDGLDALTSLVDKSLLRRVDGADGEPRFERLLTIRAFARDRLEASGEAERWRRRHAEHFGGLAEVFERGRSAAEMEAAVARLEPELDNLRAAMEWALDRGEAGIALRLCQALPFVWLRRGMFEEADRWLERMETLSSSLTDPERAHVLNLSGRLAQLRGDNSPAVVERFEESLRLFRAAGHRGGTARALMNLGNVRSRQGAYDEAHRLFEESLEIYRELDDPVGVPGALMNIGDASRAEGDLDRALRYFGKAAEFSRGRGNRVSLGYALQYLGAAELQRGDLDRAGALFTESFDLFEAAAVRPGQAWCRYYQGLLALTCGDLDAARAGFTEALTVFRELRHPPGIADALLAFATLAAAESRCEHAARLLGASQVARRGRSLTRQPLELAAESRVTEGCAAAFGEAAFEQAVARGRDLDPMDAAALALEDAAPAAV